MLNRLREFMYGRNGLDPLNIALLVFYFVLSLFLSWNYWLRILAFLPLILAAVRMFSRNLAARRTENDRFMIYWNKAKNFFTKWNTRLQDTNHKYVKCHNCKQTLRLPKGRGKLTITCPKCGTSFVRKT